MHDIRPFIKLPFEEPGDLLYIGYRPDACSWLQELWRAGNSITVLEVWPPNVGDDDRVARFVVGDVRDVNKIFIGSRFDYIFWWHGPEHVDKWEFVPTLNALRARTDRLLAVAAPWGKYEQGSHEGNPFEEHRWSVYESDFNREGLSVAVDGTMDEPGSEIVGWWEP